MFFLVKFLCGNPVCTTILKLLHVRAVLFFIPSNLGTQEGVFVLAVNILKDSMPLGLAVAFIRRMRELIWISCGVIFGYNQKINIKKIKQKL